jgi:hypothetical protein
VTLKSNNGAGVLPREIEAAFAHATSVADRQKTLCLAAVNFTLFHGRPMLMYEQLGTFLSFTKHSDFAPAHWKDDAGWEFASSVNSVLIDHMKRDFTQPRSSLSAVTKPLMCLELISCQFMFTWLLSPFNAPITLFAYVLL